MSDDALTRPFTATTFLDLKLMVSAKGMERGVPLAIVEFDLLDGPAGEDNTKMWEIGDNVAASLAGKPGAEIYVEPKEREPSSPGEFIFCTDRIFVMRVHLTD